MTVTRGIVFLALFTLVAVWVVQVRSERVRLTARAHRLQEERIELEREAWALEAQIARLRTPEHIRSRAERWCLGLSAPRPPLDPRPEQRFASR